MSYIEKENRRQSSFLPDTIEEYVDEDNPVRVIDAFVDSLDLKALGFTKAEPASTGRPAYDPGDLLKLYIYGYMNKVRTSRGLMKECRRNIEVFYLLGKLKPDFRTIADFRKENADAIKKVFKEFVYLCNEHGLYIRELIAIDGTKIRARNSDDKAFNKDILEKKLARINAHIEEYMDTIDRLDESGEDDDEEDDHRLNKAKIETTLRELNKRKARYSKYLDHLNNSTDTQILLTDPEAHRMHTNNGFHRCYNIQAATDTESHLICEYEVTNKTNDMGQLAGMSEKARAVLVLDNLTVVADKGYDSRKDILATLMKGIIPNVAMKYDKDEMLFNMQYDESNITDKIRNSKKPADIEKCFKAGISPTCFENSIVSVEIQNLAGIACFRRLDENTVLCPMNKVLRKLKRRRDRQTIFKSREACRTCDNRCTSSINPKEVCFVDGVKYVPVRMYGARKAINVLPKDAVISPISRALSKKKASQKVIIRLKCDKEKLIKRMCTVEHPFGSIKWYGDAGYLLCKGKRKVSGEIGLSFLAYNIKRAIKMVGVKELIAAMGT